ncbi:hypothetical protein Phi4:1_gp077 [Cellulophaga phage phi4:1]|uniref:Uncharacterized protein n=5 Tax=Lightbulbvirus TaxID=1918522 RepID=A0A0S2MWJ1_9CAUD|nr:hypothetical protein Phi4:1_gp077 [Cellulophaga phage phi4:1]YP_008241574.1 hypothetical protein Phi17:2_gp079 [Cellulophaga phage phi17:2]ALO80086.1 hypothetical protein Phi4113_077 [Cellulophaga phage phi4:1_13]ALO80283.1 hypothetical protein Phi4118_077 [Cellulophaga phage phi4:1_18]ALO80482.1 hypothetical protein Phi17218_079 [Cellulophaga phage phi17:2_18]AGO47612.1 hypothetical protein Phi17:2_gp079 [Cellulophaga phage phi17:2]AGO49490.1 hypothetical protein Phi4:1_gp077 [Cellulophag
MKRSKKRWNWTNKFKRKTLSQGRRKCKCNWCLSIEWRNRKRITVKKDLEL